MNNPIPRMSPSHFDLIAWNGVITTYGAVKHFMDVQEDEWRYANQWEIMEYRKHNSK